MAGAFFFNVTLHGYGGHGSRPDMAKSPIEAFISIQNELRAYRMRAVAPEQSLTYSVGCVNAGSKANIIPSELSFAGTMRCTDNENGKSFRSFFLLNIKNPPFWAIVINHIIKFYLRKTSGWGTDLQLL